MILSLTRGASEPGTGGWRFGQCGDLWVPKFRLLRSCGKNNYYLNLFKVTNHSTHFYMDLVLDGMHQLYQLSL